LHQVSVLDAAFVPVCPVVADARRDNIRGFFHRPARASGRYGTGIGKDCRLAAAGRQFFQAAAAAAVPPPGLPAAHRQRLCCGLDCCWPVWQRHARKPCKESGRPLDQASNTFRSTTMRDTFPLLVSSHFPPIRRRRLETLQVNLGYRCNQACLHCHVAAGPKRTEEMRWETMQLLLEFVRRQGIRTLDLTGGAPEMNPHFRRLVIAARAMDLRIIDRCNLTILNEPGYESLADFLAEQAVEVTASLPCYLEENVDRQRGDGVFKSSIAALRQLNRLGYGVAASDRVLNLVYNPVGPTLPPDQVSLEEAYKEQLAARYGIVFNRLLALTNMPIKRFGSQLLSRNAFHDYMQLLKSAHQDANLDGVMCRSLLSVSWQGHVFDCDFNQMLDLPLGGGEARPVHLSELLAERLDDRAIRVADHCYGCTAGQGSSCGGALADSAATEPLASIGVA
jgi:radical SAM/Cys-rich protein